MNEGRLGAVEIARARPGEEEAASAILQEAARWLAATGREMWDPEDFAPDTLRTAASAGELYLARLNGEPVGTMVLQWEDPVFWPEVTAGDSAFVHRLAVKRSVAGTGVSRALLAYAERAARRAGRKYLRLDTDPARPRLCAFYESAGFVRHSVTTVGRYVIARYELALGDTTLDGRERST